MAERTAKKTGTTGARGARHKAAAPPKPRARQPRITQADFDALFARMDEKLARMEETSARVSRAMGL